MCSSNSYHNTGMTVIIATTSSHRGQHPTPDSKRIGAAWSDKAVHTFFIFQAIRRVVYLRWLKGKAPHGPVWSQRNVAAVL